MGDADPYKHIRALALSIANIEKQIDAEPNRPMTPEPAVTAAAIRADRGVEAFTEMLRAARERRGLTQRDLGRLAGVPQSHISKIESGAVDLRLSSLLALAAVLDLELVLTERARPERPLLEHRGPVHVAPPVMHRQIPAASIEDAPITAPALRETAAQ